MTPANHIHLEQAEAADVDRLVQLHADAFAEDVVRYGKGPPGYDDVTWHREMLAEHSYLKIMVGETLAGGLIVVDKGQGHFFLDTLFVHPRFQNVGIGQRAMVFLEQAFPAARSWTLLTPHRSYRNHYFYEKLGFRKIGEMAIENKPGLADDFCLFRYEKLMLPGEASTLPEEYSPAIRVGQHPYSTRVTVRSGSRSERIVPLNYLLYLPDAYGENQLEKWPLILYLHGRGERGEDLELLKKHPLPKTLDRQSDFPFIVVSPQLSLELELWTEMVEPLNALLDQIQAAYSVDTQRIYVTGLSMGGAGTWDLGLRYPERFAALAPIASFYNLYSLDVPGNICDLKNVPIWAFHGDSDEIVPHSRSEVLVEALKRCGGNVRLTLYPGADHVDSWMRAYADPELYSWLLSHRRG